MLLFRQCFVPKVDYIFRTISPRLSHVIFGPFEELKRQILASLLQIPRQALSGTSYEQAQLPIARGGLGLTNSKVVAHAAYCVPAIDWMKHSIPGTSPKNHLFVPGENASWSYHHHHQILKLQNCIQLLYMSKFSFITNSAAKAGSTTYA